MTTRVWRHDARHGETVPSWCGPAMQARLHSDWLTKLPDAMRAAAVTPYQAGTYTPANPDCVALIDIFEHPPRQLGGRAMRGIRHRPSRRIRVRRTPLPSALPDQPSA